MAAVIYDTTTLEDGQADIAWALTALARHRSDYLLHRDYYRGKHRPMVATDQYEAAFNAIIHELRANICPRVVHAITDRLEVMGFEGDEATVAAAWELYTERGLDDLLGRLFDTAVSQGDAYLLVWPDEDGDPRFYLHDALTVCHRHDAEKEELITLAAKLFQVGKRWQLNLYYPDRLEKYRTDRDDTAYPSRWQSFVRYQPDDEAWPVPNEWGTVPVFHFPYEPDTHDHGTSLLRDVVPIQNTLNASLVQLVIAGEFAAWEQRVIIGIEPLSEADRLRVGMNRIITIDNIEAKIGQWTATNLQNFTLAMTSHCSQIAMITGIPPHYFFLSGDFPSGESLKTAESSLVKKVGKTQRTMGPSVAAAVTFALLIRGVSAEGLVTVWESAESRDDTALVERLATLVREGIISKRKAAEEYGYTADEIAQMEQEKELEAAASAASFGTAFDQA